MSELLAKTFRSRTIKLALLSIAIFGAMVVALFGYVYWSTASFVRTRSDHAIATELASLHEAYTRAGRGGLITMIAQRIADQRLESSVYLVADPSFTPLAGNLENWLFTTKSASGWGSFGADEGRRLVRAIFETLPDGSHVLVGKDIDVRAKDHVGPCSWHLVSVRTCWASEHARHAAHSRPH